MVATHRHDGQVKLLIDPQDIRIIGALTDYLVTSLSEQLQVAGEPTQSSLVRPNSAVLKEEIIEDSFQRHLNLTVGTGNLIVAGFFPYNCVIVGRVYTSGQIQNVGAVWETEEIRYRILRELDCRKCLVLIVD